MLFAPRDINEYDKWFLISEKNWRERMSDPRFLYLWTRVKKMQEKYAP